MIRSAIYSILGIFLSIPAFAHEGHEEAMHHWEDVRYIKEVHIQLVVLVIVGLLLGVSVYMKRKRNPA